MATIPTLLIEQSPELLQSIQNMTEVNPAGAQLTDANVKECWETAIGEIAAIDAGSDADLLAWARSVKSNIRAHPY